ncbi:MAG: ribosome-associated translation inhibitor RaiA [bacterium]|nr:ribosome-associated translation inhibitor RaiA [bacterium]
MEIKLNSKNFDITPAIGNYAEKRFSKLKKYFEGLLEIHINLVKEGKGNEYSAEVSIFGDGVVLHSEDKQEDLYQSMDMVVEKLERQLKRHKDKLKIRKTKKSMKTELIEEAFSGEEEFMVGEDRVVYLPMNTKPMSSEEAVLQLKGSKLTFIMFLNTETNKINLIYKRKDGVFAIITP